MTAIVSMPSERNRGQVEAGVDETPVGHAPAVIALHGVGHVAAEKRPPVDGARHAPPGPSLRRRRAACPGPWRGWPPGAWLRPRPAPPRRHRPGTERPPPCSATGGRIHDFAGAGGIAARRCVGASESESWLVAVLADRCRRTRRRTRRNHRRRRGRGMAACPRHRRRHLRRRTARCCRHPRRRGPAPAGGHRPARR